MKLKWEFSKSITDSGPDRYSQAYNKMDRTYLDMDTQPITPTTHAW